MVGERKSDTCKGDGFGTFPDPHAFGLRV